MIRRPPRSTLSSSSAASDVYKRQLQQLGLLLAALTLTLNHPGTGLAMLTSEGARTAVLYELQTKLQAQHTLVMGMLKEAGVLSQMSNQQAGALSHCLNSCFSFFYKAEERLVHERVDDIISNLSKGSGTLSPNLVGFVPFFFNCLVRSQIAARPTHASLKYFHSLMAESETLGCGDSLTLEHFLSKKLYVSSSFQEPILKRKLYATLKFYIEETVEVPLFALSGLCQPLMELIDNVRALRKALSKRVQEMEVGIVEDAPALSPKPHFQRYHENDLRRSWKMNSVVAIAKSFNL
eukprot:TRINITY_DN50040_c0_g1_i2.p1 TRINITY_DN50040_c0_g1~~TRINITY_DN50040_c0_g1_i2.p1  ORF type:complete len:294 (-),score=86.01 TRINITY_DN50040_c0_g1_i2:449-1330(-)